MDWICTLNKKKQQRHINKLVRKMNKNIEQDELWKVVQNYLYIFFL